LYVRDARAAMNQQPEGLSRQQVGQVFESFLKAGVTPDPDDFRAALVAKWVREVWPRSIREVEA
jgi:hypothetical protein